MYCASVAVWLIAKSGTGKKFANISSWPAVSGLEPVAGPGAWPGGGQSLATTGQSQASTTTGAREGACSEMQATLQPCILARTYRPSWCCCWQVLAGGQIYVLAAGVHLCAVLAGRCWPDSL